MRRTRLQTAPGRRSWPATPGERSSPQRPRQTSPHRSRSRVRSQGPGRAWPHIRHRSRRSFFVRDCTGERDYRDRSTGTVTAGSRIGILLVVEDGRVSMCSCTALPRRNRPGECVRLSGEATKLPPLPPIRHDGRCRLSHGPCGDAGLLVLLSYLLRSMDGCLHLPDPLYRRPSPRTETGPRAHR